VGHNLFFPVLWGVALIFQGLGHDSVFINLARGKIGWITATDISLIISGCFLFLQPLKKISWLLALLSSILAFTVALPYPPNNRILSLIITITFAAPVILSRKKVSNSSTIPTFGDFSSEPELRAFAIGRVACQAIAILIYIFAAVAKINSDFIWGDFSCAKDLATRIFPRLGWPLLPTETLAIGAIGIELLIPFGLMFRRTQHITAVIGLIFHIFLTIDSNHRYYNFSAVMIALLSLFLRGGFMPNIGSFLIKATTLTMVSALFFLNLWAPHLAIGLYLTREILWFIICLAIFSSAIKESNLEQNQIGISIPPLRKNLLGLCMITIVVLNGISPYLGIKTYGSWDMYSNLKMEGRKSNHLFIDRLADISGTSELAVNKSTRSIKFSRMFIEPGEAIPIQVISSLVLGGKEKEDIVFSYRGATYSCPKDRERCDFLKDHKYPNKLLFFRPVDEPGPVKCNN